MLCARQMKVFLPVHKKFVEIDEKMTKNIQKYPKIATK
jgi:hypothetical protein